MDDRYEEEYRLYWKVCLNDVKAPADRMQVLSNPEYLKREMAKDPNAASDPFWLFEKMTEHRTAQRATDQNDLFKLKGEDEFVRMHPECWKWTIDAVLAEYMYLVMQSKEKQTIKVPLEIQNARANYARLSVAAKEQKKLRIPYEKFQMVGRDKIKCWLPKYTGKAMLNLWCHDLCLDRRGTNLKTEIFFDGVRYVPKQIKDSGDGRGSEKEKVTSDDLTRSEDEAKKKWNPKDDFLTFTLGDYIFHELATGVSLSIEITAALMELDPSIRDAALEAFFKKGLAEVTHSKLLYTRIAVARSFFHQIHLVWCNNAFAGKNTYERPPQDPAISWNAPAIGVGFEDAVDFACQDLQILDWSGADVPLAVGTVYVKPGEEIWINGEDIAAVRKTDRYRAERSEAEAPWIEEKDREEADLWLHTRAFSIWRESVPEDGRELEALICYYEGLLEMVEYPLNMEKWKAESPLNLALFVQPQHDHVPIILDYLKTGSMRKGSIREKYESWEEPPVLFEGPSKTCIDYFKKVHSKVQEACAASIKASINTI